MIGEAESSEVAVGKGGGVRPRVGVEVGVHVGDYA